MFQPTIAISGGFDIGGWKTDREPQGDNLEPKGTSFRISKEAVGAHQFASLPGRRGPHSAAPFEGRREHEGVGCPHPVRHRLFQRSVDHGQLRPVHLSHGDHGDSSSHGSTRTSTCQSRRADRRDEIVFDELPRNPRCAGATAWLVALSAKSSPALA